MKIASIVETTSCSQSNFYMTKTFNKMLGTEISPVCFYLNLSSLSAWNQFAIMNIYYASGFFDGIMIATSFKTAEVLSKINTNAYKYLYLQDLEWLRGPTQYEDNLKLLKNFKILSRSTSHHDNIMNYCNMESTIVDNWNYESLRGLMEDYDRRTDEKRV